MDAKRIVTGALVGGVAMYLLGYLIFVLAFGGFYAANVGSATGVDRDVPLQWAIALGTLALATLVTLAVDSRPGTASMAQGFVTGGVVGFLVWMGANFIIYGATNVQTLTRTIVDPLLEFVRTGVAGAIIAAVLARGAKAARVAT